MSVPIPFGTLDSVKETVLIERGERKKSNGYGPIATINSFQSSISNLKDRLNSEAAASTHGPICTIKVTRNLRALNGFYNQSTKVTDNQQIQVWTGKHDPSGNCPRIFPALA